MFLRSYRDEKILRTVRLRACSLGLSKRSIFDRLLPKGRKNVFELLKKSWRTPKGQRLESHTKTLT
jgi:hypothetical protein